jgi:hypothetical protein
MPRAITRWPDLAFLYSHHVRACRRTLSIPLDEVEQKPHADARVEDANHILDADLSFLADAGEALRTGCSVVFTVLHNNL